MNGFNLSQNLSIGIDIEHIERFNGLDRTKNGKFLNRIFTAKELDYCFAHGKPAPHLTARFAGKEALIKAATDLGIKLNYHDIEILNNESGVPLAHITNKDHQQLTAKISLSHEQDKAIGLALVIKSTSDNQLSI